MIDYLQNQLSNKNGFVRKGARALLLVPRWMRSFSSSADSLAARRALLGELRGLAGAMESMRLSTTALADRLPGAGE